MTGAIRIQSRADKDGVLNLRVPLGASEADAEVVVTIERPDGSRASYMQDWHAFIAETYGSCAGLGLERRDQGAFEEREAIE